MRVGRQGSIPWQWMVALSLRANPRSLTIPVSVDEPLIEHLLRNNLTDTITDPQNAILRLTVSPTSSVPIVTITPERAGRIYDFSAAFRELRASAEHLRFDPIVLHETVREPTVVANDLRTATNDLPRWMIHLPLRLTVDQSSWSISTGTYLSWLDAAREDQGWKLRLDPARIDATVRPLLEGYLTEPKTGMLTIDVHRAQTFIPPVEGIALDATATARHIEDAKRNATTTEIVLVHEQPMITGDAEMLGIREVVGVGRSHFSGSPVNRRKNIALGAQKVNGSLIAPGEEFSLLKTLGTVDGDHGWLPELVIKGDKTTPEFGGGLCQIGTTTFRSVLGSGLPVTERRNHSYRVRYYEPAGTDATIYEPSPDFKFKNDTDHWLLFTTDMRKDDLTFTLWGTRDGRMVEQTPSRLTNIVPPPEKKIIETLDLKPGETKCTEIAHAGADASFDYRVTYPSGKIQKVSFYSHYRPWGAVCLLGVAHLTASSTPQIQPELTP